MHTALLGPGATRVDLRVDLRVAPRKTPGPRVRPEPVPGYALSLYKLGPDRNG